jgi:hypothetical protein
MVEIPELSSSDKYCGEYLNVTDALLEIATALKGVAEALHQLGGNHASGPMGAVELVAVELRNGLDSIAGAISEVGTQLSE